MRRNINSKKYSKIKSLLQSHVKEDIIIGIMLLKKTEFDYEDYCRNFPNDHKPNDFPTNYKGQHFWVDIGHTFIGVSEVIYCPRESEETVDSWRVTFKDEEIKL